MEAVQQLLVDFVETTPKGYCPSDQHQWFASTGRRAMDLLLLSQKKSLKHEAVAKTLKEGLKLDEEVADDLARQFFDEHTMELGH